jgi:hypothetical protein
LGNLAVIAPGAAPDILVAAIMKGGRSHKNRLG